MFGIDSSELAVIALVALLVIGPKDLPRVMRLVGQWVAKGRAMTRHVRSGFDAMMREAELEEMQKQWAAQNEAIMKATALPDLGLAQALPDLATDHWMTPLPPETEMPADAAIGAPPKTRRRAKPADEGAGGETTPPKRKRVAKARPEAKAAADAPAAPTPSES